MNTVFLNILKKDILNFVANATEKDCALVVEKFYSKGFYDYILKLRENTVKDKDSSPISFVSQFPEKTTILPCFSFILGNIQADLGIQTYSYETGELTDEEYKAYRHLASTIQGEHQTYVNTKSYIHQTQVVIGCYANNKLEVSWLLYLADFLVKFRTEEFALLGMIDIATSQTDLRLQQEMFPLAVPTRILTVNFKYEKVIPRIDQTSHPFGGAEILMSTEETDSPEIKINI